MVTTLLISNCIRLNWFTLKSFQKGPLLSFVMVNIVSLPCWSSFRLLLSKPGQGMTSHCLKPMTTCGPSTCMMIRNWQRTHFWHSWPTVRSCTTQIVMGTMPSRLLVDWRVCLRRHEEKLWEAPRSQIGCKRCLDLGSPIPPGWALWSVMKDSSPMSSSMGWHVMENVGLHGPLVAKWYHQRWILYVDFHIKG